MADDEADFAAFATAAMAESSGTAPELLAPTPTEAPPTPEAPKTEPVAEAPKEEPKVEAAPEKKDEPPAWKVAAEKEKAARAARGASKAEAAKLQQQLKEVNAELAEWREFKALRDKDPLAAAERAKLPYDTLTKEYIKTLEGKPDEATSKYDALNQKLQQVETLLQQQQARIDQEAQAKAVSGFTAEVKQVLESKADEFELTKAARQGPDLVREIVAAHYRATATFDSSGRLISPGEIMATEQACKLAEKYLEEDLAQFKSTKKFSGKTEAPKPAAKPATTQTLSQDLRQATTKNEPHGDEVEQLLLLKKTLEAQLNAQQGN